MRHVPELLKSLGSGRHAERGNDRRLVVGSAARQPYHALGRVSYKCTRAPPPAPPSPPVLATTLYIPRPPSSSPRSDNSLLLAHARNAPCSLRVSRPRPFTSLPLRLAVA